MRIVCRWVWTIGACIIHYNHAWEKGKNGRDAFRLRPGGHNWIVIMHQHNIRTISFNNCKLPVGLRLIQWKQYLEEGVRFSNNCHQIILVNQFFFGIEVLKCSSSYSHNFTYIEILAFRQVLHAGPRWTATLVCHMHRSSLEICILCCNFTSRTMGPQDSRMEHERATETRATGLHLGNSAANVFDLERH